MVNRVEGGRKEKLAAAGPEKSDGDATVRHSCPLGASGRLVDSHAPARRAGVGRADASSPGSRPRHLESQKRS